MDRTEDEADGFNEIDISSKVSALEYDDEVLQNCIITLNAKGGRFNTRGPIIRKWDKVYVEIVDRNGDRVADVFHVKIRKKKLQNGLQLQLHCSHESSELWKRTVSLPARRYSGKQALDTIVEILNENRAAKDPFVTNPVTFDNNQKTGNRLDPNTSNDYIFESVKLEAAFDELTRIELNPVEGGGSFEPFFIRFKSQYNHADHTGREKVLLQAFEQGYTAKDNTFGAIPKATLHHTQTKRQNLLTMDSNLEVERGTNIITIASRKAGSYPKHYSQYGSALEVFRSAKSWVDNRRYRIGSLVQNNGSTYECITEHISSSTNSPAVSSVTWTIRNFVIPPQWQSGVTYGANTVIRNIDIAYRCVRTHSSSIPPPTSNWIRISYLPTVDYSPLTKNGAQYWINALSGGKFARTSNPRTVRSLFNRTAMVDPNVVIKHESHPRTWVDRVVQNPNDIPDTEKFEDGTFVNTYRVLVVNPTTGVSVGTGDFAGSDRNGVEYAGRVVEWDDEDGDGIGEWVVLTFIRCNDDQEIAEWNENISWTKNPVIGGGSFLTPTNLAIGGTRSTVWLKGSYALAEIINLDGIVKILSQIGEAISDFFTHGIAEFVFTDVLGLDFDPTDFEGQLLGKFFEGLPFQCFHNVEYNIDQGVIACGNTGISPSDTTGTSAVYIESRPASLAGENREYCGLNFAFPWPRNSNEIPYGNVENWRTD